jgi:ubiquinone/menaquinone biosynthesis C-methylase UbiE
MDKNYFIEYYNLERSHWWFKARAELLDLHIKSIVDFLPPKAELKILNVGAGTGLTTLILMKYGNVTSVEYDINCCEMVKEKLNLDFHNESITALPYADNTFDLVTSFDVIEHIEDDAKAVDELIRVTKYGGRIVTTVPTFMFLWGQHDLVNHHYRRYTKENYSQLWKRSNEIKFHYRTYFNFFLFPVIAGFRLLAKLLPKKSIRDGAGSDFSVKYISSFNVVPYYIFRAEKFFFKNLIRLPFGVSMLLSVDKKPNNNV